MSRRGMKKGSRCVRKHRNGRCAKFSSSGGAKKRKGGKAPKRKPKEKSFLQQMEERYKSTPTRLYSSRSYEKEEAEPARTRGKFTWSGDKWSPLAGLFGRRKRR